MEACSIGDKLRELRGTRKQTEVAAAVGITKAALSMYETGARVPKDSIKKELAKYFGVNVGTLFYEE